MDPELKAIQRIRRELSGLGPEQATRVLSFVQQGLYKGLYDAIQPSIGSLTRQAEQLITADKVYHATGGQHAEHSNDEGRGVGLGIRLKLD